MTSVSHLDDLSVWNPTLYAPTFYSRPQLLARRHLLSTAPSLKSVLNYFSLSSQKTQLLSLTLSHLHLIYSTSLKLLIFRCLGLLWPHLNPFQGKTTLNYQGNKWNLPDLHSSYWTPSNKNPWWMDPWLMFSALPQLEKTEQPLLHFLYKMTITGESHMAGQSCYRPSPLPLIPLKDHHKPLLHNWYTITNLPHQRLLAGEWEVEIFR